MFITGYREKLYRDEEFVWYGGMVWYQTVPYHSCVRVLFAACKIARAFQGRCCSTILCSI